MRKKTAIIIVILALWSAVFISLRLNPDYPMHSISSIYLVISKSFTMGEGYCDVALPEKAGMLEVPSGFPLFLAPYFLWMEPHIIIYKLLLAVLLVAGTCAGLFWLSRFIGEWPALLVMLSYAATRNFIWFGTEMASETLFIPVLYTALFLDRTRSGEPAPAWQGWAALVLWVFLARIRVVGIPFLLTALTLLLMKRSWKKLAAGVLLFGIWMAVERSLRVTSPGFATYSQSFFGGYLNSSNPLHAIVYTYIHNIWAFAGSMYAQVLLPFLYGLHPMNIIKRLIVLGVFLVGCFGLGLLWKNEKDIRPVLIGLFVSLLPVFQWHPTETIFRYLSPFYPFLALCLFYPFRELARKVPRRGITVLPAILLGLLVLNQAVHSFAMKREKDVFGWGDFGKLHDYVIKAPVKPAVVLSMAHYYTDLKTGVHSCTLSPSDKTESLKPCFSTGETWVIAARDETGKALLARKQLDTSELAEPPLAVQGRWAIYAVRPGKKE